MTGLPRAGKGFDFLGDALDDIECQGVGAGFAVRKEDSALRDALSQVILDIRADGAYKAFWLSLIVTIGCLVLAYPVSHLLATLPLRHSNLLMICVLMPFWTSLLVRIVAWMVMLRSEGVVNDTLGSAISMKSSGD